MNSKTYKTKKMKPLIITGISLVVIVILVVVALAVAPYIFSIKHQKRLQRIQNNEEQLNVIIVTIDTTRTDYIGCYGNDNIETPNIDYFAKKGTRFENCRAVVPLTLPAHSSIMTGTYPPYTNVRSNDMFLPDELNLTIAEVLSENGYETAAFVSAFTLFEDTGIGQGFQIYNDDTLPEGIIAERPPLQRRGDRTWQVAREWLNDREDDKPFFMFLHFYDPHTPYAPPDPYDKRYPDDPYSGEIAYVDFILGNLLPTLEKNSYDKNTLIIITADHGELLGEHGEEEHGIFLYEPAIHVPFIMYCPGLVPSRKTVSTPISHTDIAPTIYEILNVEAPEVIHGDSLIPILFGSEMPNRPIYSESLYARRSYGWGSYYSIYENKWKFIEAPQPEIYNLAVDPLENSNTIETDAEKATEMSKLLDSYKAKYSEKEFDVEELEADPKHLEMLASLGYLGDSATGNSSTENDTAADLIDAKDRTEFINLLHHANKYRIEGDLEKTAKTFERMLEFEPDSPFTLSQLGNTYFSMGEYDKAADIYKKLHDKNPGNWTKKMSYAAALIQLKEYDKAEPMIKDLLEKELPDKSLSKVYDFLGTLVNNRDYDLKSAIRYKEKAIELNSKSVQTYFDLAFICAENKQYNKSIEYSSAYLEMVGGIGPEADMIKMLMREVESKTTKR